MHQICVTLTQISDRFICDPIVFFIKNVTVVLNFVVLLNIIDDGRRFFIKYTEQK